jgi:shikimate kinase
MRALLAQREPLYRMADVAVDTSTGTPRQVVDRILGLIEGRTRARKSPRR